MNKASLDPEVSIVIPTHNQGFIVAVTLRAFLRQSLPPDQYEIILVDNASTDGTAEIINSILSTANRPTVKLESMAYPNRSAARNMGTCLSRGKIILYNDADRIPCYNFIASHLEAQQKWNSIIIGVPMDVYLSAPKARIREVESNFGSSFEGIMRRGRIPSIAKIALSMFSDNGEYLGGVPWICFFSGNVSVPREIALAFPYDSDFTTWGLENIELGFRLASEGIRFYLSTSARNYHIAHRRPHGFYVRNLRYAIIRFAEVHGKTEARLLWEFFVGRLSIGEYAMKTQNRGALSMPQLGADTIYRAICESPSVSADCLDLSFPL